MGFEVMPRVGQLRTRDVRAVLGGGFATATHVDVLVLGDAGERPSAACVALADMAGGGRGKHRGLVCPKCAAPKVVLLTDGMGGLGCAGCLKRRTRRQKERTLASWRRGGQLEDELFRRLFGPQAQAPGTMRRSRKLVEEIVEGDLHQLSALALGVDAALAMAARVEARTCGRARDAAS